MSLAQDLRAWLTDELGLEPALLGDGRLEHALAAAMAATGVLDPGAYLDRVRGGGAGEREALISEVVVPETWFFRDREPFRFLGRHAAGSWSCAHPGQTLRVLSMPCASGEEPYSIAMALLDAGLSASRFQVDAVDVSPRALAAARRAVYGRSSFRENGGAASLRHFTKTAEGYALDPRLAEQIRFFRGNARDPALALPVASYDVVFCRNLLIYMTDSAKEAVLRRIRAVLAPGGLLFAGHAEVAFCARHGFAAVPPPRAFACRLGDADPVPGSGRSRAPRTGAAPRPRRPPSRDGWSAAVEALAEPSRLGRRSPTGEGGSSGSAVHTMPQGRSCARQQARAPGPAEGETALPLAAVRRLADAGQLEEARCACDRYVRERRADPEGFFLMGAIEQAADCREAAEECFRRALYLDPGHYEALVHLGLLCQEKGDGEQAARLRERAARAYEARESRGSGVPT
jgi:chemotaxis protein methyltransferase WspC